MFNVLYFGFVIQKDKRSAKQFFPNVDETFL